MSALKLPNEPLTPTSNWRAAPGVLDGVGALDVGVPPVPPLGVGALPVLPPLVVVMLIVLLRKKSNGDLPGGPRTARNS